MANLYRRRASPYWWLTWREGGRRFRESTGLPHNGARAAPRSGRAADVLEEKRVQLARVRLGLASGGDGRRPVAEWAREWLGFMADTRGLRESTRVRYGRTIDVFLSWCEAHGVGLLCELGPDAAARWAAGRARGVASKTLACDVSVLAAMWEEARARNLVGGERNPFARLRPPRVNSVGKRPLTAEEVSWLRERAGDLPAWLGYLFTAGLWTAARLTSLVYLERRNVDFGAGVVWFPDEIVKTKGYAVPLHPELRAWLLAYADKLPADQAGWCPDDVVFRHRRFRSYAQKAATRVFRIWEKASGGTLFAGVSFHSLRRTLPSRCRELGLDPAIVQKWTGHQSRAMLEHYTRADARHMVGLIGRVQFDK